MHCCICYDFCDVWVILNLLQSPRCSTVCSTRCSDHLPGVLSMSIRADTWTLFAVNYTKQCRQCITVVYYVNDVYYQVSYNNTVVLLILLYNAMYTVFRKKYCNIPWDKLHFFEKVDRNKLSKRCNFCSSKVRHKI